MSRWDGLRTLMDLLDQWHVDGPRTGLSDASAEALAQLVPSDTIALVEFSAERSTVHDFREWPSPSGLVRPDAPPPPEEQAAFWSLFWASPFCSDAEAPGRRAAITMQQDFHPGRSWRRTPIYRDFLVRAPVEAGVIVPLPGPPGRSRRLLLTRQVSHDYDEDDRLVLRLLRPHLAAALSRTGRPELTDRQREILRLVALGATNETIGRRLSLSAGTVRKHLEHAYERLGAHNRADAVARAFPDGVDDDDT